MSIALPLSIEAYLRECGLTDTEMLIIKHLLAENLLTLRELASKTGKGNSAIDAGIKKLIQRGIVTREKFNDQPKFAVMDPQSIVTWAEKNMREQAQMLQRRHQNLAEFMENLNTSKNHPAIEHFEGEQGIMRAYDKLLQNRSEVLTYTNPAREPASAALAQFHTHYNRRRKVYGVFQRIIAPDSPIARRFQSRDPFEYRKTLLIPAEEFALSFDKIITGDVVACLDETSMDASFIKYEKLADAERQAFEKQWEDQMEKERNRQDQPLTANTEVHTSLWEQALSINRLQKVFTAYFGFLILYWAVLFATGTTNGTYNYLYSFLFGLIPLLGSIPILRDFKRWGGFKHSIGKAMFCMGISLFLWGCGSLVWSYYNFFYNIPVPYPSLADLGFAPSTFLYGVGFIYLSDASGARYGLRSVHAKFFAVITPIIVLIFSYYLMVTVARGGILVTHGQSPIKTFLDIQGPVGDALALAIAILISGLSIRHMGNSYALDIVAMFVGLIVFVVADTIYSYTTTVGTYYNGNFGDLIYTTGLFLLSFGVLGFSNSK